LLKCHNGFHMKVACLQPAHKLAAQRTGCAGVASGIPWQGVLLVDCEQHDSVGQHKGTPCEEGFMDREREVRLLTR
jgi:hypothetical protein